MRIVNNPRYEDGKFTFKNGGDKEDTDDEKTDSSTNNGFVLKGSVRYDAPPPSSKIPETYTPPVKIEKPTGSLAKGSWQKPVNYIRVSSPYGWRYHPVHQKYMGHKGIDLAVPVGYKVTTPMDGIVEFAGTQNGYGYIVIINHGKIDGNVVRTKYAHLSKFDVKKGDKVQKGSNVGLSGGKKGAPGSGVSTGPHLHFEVLEGDKPVNPADYIKF